MQKKFEFLVLFMVFGFLHCAQGLWGKCLNRIFLWFVVVYWLLYNHNAHLYLGIKI